MNAVDQFLVERYTSIVGALIYMAITVRVDIALAVGKLSRGMHNPTRSHVFMLRSTVGYLKVHRSVKLTYRRQKTRIQELFNRIAATDSALQSISGYDYQGVKDPIVGMTDSDFASGSEKDRRSISGMAFFLFGNLISWLLMALEAVSPASAALPELAHLHLLAHLAGVPTEASLSYKSLPAWIVGRPRTT